uniref:FERM domain-containing protein n=1 Tax=Syphacia muris TaxID=451379 RepID=A0A158R4B9_9BILA
MCGRKISQVKFDEAGYQSIESECYMFDKDRWKSVYALCTQPSDFRSVILYIYRNYKHRLKNKELLSLASDTFYGMESGFELRKKKNTLSLITSKRVLTLAFITVEHFTMWECWLDAAFSKGAQFFGQLIKAPIQSKAYTMINREISVYIHDFGFAITTGRPLCLIDHWAIAEIRTIHFYTDHFHFSTEAKTVSDYEQIQKVVKGSAYGCSNSNYSSLYESENFIYEIVCWQMERLKAAFLAAKAGRLRQMLNKISESGHWIMDSEKSESYEHSNSATNHSNKHSSPTYYNDTNKAYKYLKVPRFSDSIITKNKRADQKSGNEIDDVLQGILKPYEPKRNERNIQEESIGKYNEASYSTADCHMHQPQQQQQQQPQLLSAVGSSITSPTLTTSEQSFQHFNDFISALQSCRESATSLPALTGQQNFIRVGSWPKSEYELFRETATNVTDSCTFLYSGRSHNELFSQLEGPTSFWQNSGTGKEVKGKYVKQAFRSTKITARGTRSFRDKKCLRRYHQRSMSVATEPTVKRSSSTREENWDRAKRIIGSMRRSSERSSATWQSRSLDRLATLPSTNHFHKSSKDASDHDGTTTSCAQASQLDLSINVENSGRLCEGLPSTSSAEQKPSPMPGLIKLPRKNFNLKKENYSFAKNLRRLITGSYSKYDGERATLNCNSQNNTSDSQPHGLEAAIDKGRARFIEAQRRRFGLESSNDSCCHLESQMHHYSSSTLDTYKKATGPEAGCHLQLRYSVSGHSNDEQKFHSNFYPTLSNTSIVDTNEPPPIPERTYKKREKKLLNVNVSILSKKHGFLQLRQVSQQERFENFEVSNSLVASGNQSIQGSGTSYMMVNEAADQFLCRLNQEPTPDCSVLPEVEKPRRRSFSIHFHRKSNCSK